MKARRMKYKNLPIVCFALFVFLSALSVCPAAWGATYYVDNRASNTSDSNPGTQAQPWKTMDHAASTMTAGDTTFVKAGTYNEVIQFDHSGTSSSPITLQAYPGDRPIVDGAGKNAPSYKGSIYGANVSNIVVDGFEIKNSDEYGIEFQYASNITIKNCYIHDVNRNGIEFMYSKDSVVEHNEVFATGWNCISSESGSNIKFLYNYVHDNPAHAGLNIFPKTIENPQGHYSGNDVIGNVTDGCAGAVYLRFQQNCIIANNVIMNDLINGICIDGNHTGETHNYTATGLVIYNNTIVNSASVGYKNYNASGVTLKNNIFSGNGAGRYAQVEIRSAAVSGSILDNNLYYSGEKIIWGGSTYSSISSFRSATGQEQHAVTADPRFVNINADNYSLTSGSSAIDKGANLSQSVSNDIDGTTRPQGNGFDIGAYEYATSGTGMSNPVVLDAPSNLRVLSVK